MPPLYSISYTLSYVVFFILLFALAIPVTTNGSFYNKSRKFQEQIAFLILFLFLGFRGFIYSDWYAYYNGFLDAPTVFDGLNEFEQFFTKSDYGPSWEKGFCIFLIICKSIIPQWWFFQAVCFLLNILVDIYFIKQFSKNHLVLGLCVYFIFGGMSYDINLMRNSKSIMLFIISLRYVAEKRIIPYMLLNGLGILFHSSAAVYLPLYFILIQKPNKILLWILFLTGNVFYLFQIKWCTPIISSVAEQFGGIAAKKMVQYLSSEQWSTGYGISIGFIERNLTFILIMHYQNRLLKNKFNIPLLHCMFIYQFSYLFFSEMSILTQRIPLLFMFAYWPLYVQIYEFQNKSWKSVFLAIFFIYSVMKIFSGAQALPNVYDNILFQKYTLEQRTSRLLRFQKYLNSQILGGLN